MNKEKKINELRQFDGVENEPEAIQEFPFDAEKISIETKPVPMGRLIERIEDGTISAPEIQRSDNLWGIVQQSRLMESLMLKIPLPLFYVAADSDENWKIVDGLQRVTAIKNFVIGRNDKSGGLQKYKFEKLEFLPQFNGMDVDDDKLPGKYKNRIKDTQFQFAVISSTTPQEAQRNVFKRLNTGGLPLNAQEIRHALYYTDQTDKLIKELASSKEFKAATNNSILDNRMAAQELVLRFIAFLIRDHSAYTKDDGMDDFLSETMRLLNLMPDFSEKRLKKFFPKDYKKYETQCKYKEHGIIREKFYSAMGRARELFGEYAFRKSISGKRTPINKALFETISVLLSEMPLQKFNDLIRDKNKVKAKIKEHFQGARLANSISKYSQKQTGVKDRYKIFNEIFTTGESK